MRKREPLGSPSLIYPPSGDLQEIRSFDVYVDQGSLHVLLAGTAGERPHVRPRVSAQRYKLRGVEGKKETYYMRHSIPANTEAPSPGRNWAESRPRALSITPVVAA